MGPFSFKAKSNFLDVVGISITDALASKLIERSKEENFTDYVADYSDRFGIFNRIVFRFFNHQIDFSGNASFNMIFESDGNFKIDKVKGLINEVANEYGKDRVGMGKWTQIDEIGFLNYWSGREWILDSKGNSKKELSVDSIQYNLYMVDINDGFGSSILGANNLLKLK